MSHACSGTLAWNALVTTAFGNATTAGEVCLFADLVEFCEFDPDFNIYRGDFCDNSPSFVTAMITVITVKYIILIYLEICSMTMLYRNCH